MNHVRRIVASVAAIATAMVGAPDARSADNAMPNAYTLTRLVSNLANRGAVLDPNLLNPWGIAFTPAGSPFWVADNAKGVSTLYDGAGTINPLVVTIPGPAGSAAGFVGSPTGMAWNPTTNANTGFAVPGTSVAAEFAFATEDGTISVWAPAVKPPTRAVLAVDNAAAGPGAVYKGLVFGINESGVFLFATNFRAGTVDVFDHTFAQVSTDGGFADPDIPAGFAPFGIQNIDGTLFVTYALQDAARHDDVAGLGNGFVDVFDTDGHLLRRLATQGTLNSPWGVARAALGFGRFGGDILVGNFGDGRISAFDSNGRFLGQLDQGSGRPLSINGLWTLTLGGGAKSNPDTLYFTAGPNGETNGVFGTIAPAAASN